MVSASSGCVEWGWAARWFGDAVCEPRDKIGFIIGLVSVVLWALAEVPQLAINAIEGSSEGLSEALLWLWVFSDVLDVVGCSISDTLPTMLITAWMYFTFTLLLLAQHIYYTRYSSAGQHSPNKQVHPDSEALSAYGSGGDDLVADLQEALLPQHQHQHTAMPLPLRGTHAVYGSLRNLSIRQSSRSSSLSFTDTGRRLHDSFVQRLHHHRGLLPPAVLAGPGRPPTADAATIRSLRTVGLSSSHGGTPAAGKLLAGVSLLALVALAGSISTGPLHSSSSGGSRSDVFVGGANVPADGELLGISYTVWGAVMGWAMAVTFFLGRVPQVIKNWRRQSCAGLSVEMFLVVFSAAATYCASILIRARNWSDLAPKLPFLTDAAVGALLDLVILAQFMVYRSADTIISSPATPGTDGSSQGHGGKSVSAEAYCEGHIKSSRTHNTDAPIDKVAVFSSLLSASEADIHGQHECDTTAVWGNYSCAEVATGDPGVRIDLDHHVDILVIDHHPDQGAPEVTVSSYWSEDALSLSSAATV